MALSNWQCSLEWEREVELLPKAEMVGVPNLLEPVLNAPLLLLYSRIPGFCLFKAIFAISNILCLGHNPARSATNSGSSVP